MVLGLGDRLARPMAIDIPGLVILEIPPEAPVAGGEDSRHVSPEPPPAR